MGAIVVAGGYGAFGSRVVERLARHGDLALVIAGRDRAKAEAAAAAQRQSAKARVFATRLDATAATAADLKELGARVVVNASGPFQIQDLGLARAAIAAGSHYIDLADARAFVMGISALDAQARRAGVRVVSGASSVPGVSSAVVAGLAPQFSHITDIDIGISPGNSFDPGPATTASILSGLGQPIVTFQDGRAAAVFGWQGLRRVAIPGLGRRWMCHVDVPDLELFPQAIPNLRGVRFRAGLEVSLYQFGLYGLSWLVRLGLLRRPERFAATLMRAKRILGFLGSDRGGMFVEVRGLGCDGTARAARWTLLAGNGHGPFVPALGAAVLARKMARGQVQETGAVPCYAQFTLDEVMAEAEGLAIRTVLDDPRLS